MHERIVRHVDMRRVAWAGFALVIIAALALFVHGTSPAVRAQTASDDCFGGALTEDSIHCEVFEWAHNTGVIEVDAVYRAGNALYIYLTQSDRLDDAALQEMLGNSQEVARRTGEHDCVLESLLCASGELSAEQLDIPGYILPKSPAYDVIEVFPGGAEARRSSPGWQAFQQFWPEDAGGAGGATGTGGDFDISGVDRTTFPTLSGNCDSLVNDAGHYSCIKWSKYPDLRIAATEDRAVDDKVYVYVKVAAGEDEAAKLAAARAVLMPAQPDYYTEERLVVVAVPHDFEELWRWSLVLDRFANSSGNTLGITLAELGFNSLGGLNRDRKYVFPLEDAPDLTGYISEHGWPDGSRWRLIIHVETLDFEGTVAGLPRLLGQLEIPESAVGLIYELKHENPGRGEPVPGPVINPSSGSAALPGSSVAVGPVGMPWWTWAAASAAGLMAVGLGGLVALRLRSAAKGGSVR